VVPSDHASIWHRYGDTAPQILDAQTWTRKKMKDWKEKKEEEKGKKWEGKIKEKEKKKRNGR